MNMEPKEGYYKFSPRFVAAVKLQDSMLTELNRWRERLFALKLIGMYQDGELKGVGYGNISARTPRGFIITATRTGGLEHLGPQHYTEIIETDVSRNAVGFLAENERIIPSAECMTHAMFYQVDPAIGAVIHVHHLDFWKRLLNTIPTTDPAVAYGTPEMAQEVSRLYRDTDLPNRKLAVMAGHEEGIISFGSDLEEAGEVLLKAWKSEVREQ